MSTTATSTTTLASITRLEDGSLIKSLGPIGDGDGEFHCAFASAVDTIHDRLIVTDCNNGRVQVLSSDGAFLFHLTGVFYRPTGVAFDACSARILVSELDSDRVQAFSSEHGSVAWSVEPSNDADTNQQQQPLRRAGVTSIAIDPRGRVYLCMRSSHQVQVWSREGERLATFGSRGRQSGELDHPNAIVIDTRHDRVWVCDTHNHRVQAFTRDGEWLLSFGEKGTEAGQFTYPDGIAIDQLGRVIVADTGNGRLQAFTPDGEYIASLELGYAPFSITIDPQRQGRMIVSVAGATQLLLIDGTQWLPYWWQVDTHASASKYLKQVVLTMTMIRTLEHTSVFSLMPNELLFEIFAFL